MDKTDKAFLAKGYWYQVTPLASIKPEEWIVGIYKKGKHSWVTEHCKGGFKDPMKAIEYAQTFIHDRIYEDSNCK